MLGSLELAGLAVLLLRQPDLVGEPDFAFGGTSLPRKV
jgi:hypothetical protein